MLRIIAIGGLLLVVTLVAALWMRGRATPIGPQLYLDRGTHYAVEVDIEAPRFAEYMGALRENRWALSEKIARESVHENLSSPGAHFNLGMILHWQRKHQEAVQEWTEAIRLDPTHEGAALMLQHVSTQS